MKLKFVTNRISSIKCFKFEFFSVHCIWYCSECCCCRCCCCRRRRRRRLSQFKTVAADPMPRLSSSSPLPIAAPSGQFRLQLLQVESPVEDVARVLHFALDKSPLPAARHIFHINADSPANSGAKF